MLSKRFLVRVWLFVGLAASLWAVDPAVAESHRRMLVLDTHFDTAMFLPLPGWSVMERRSWARDLTQVDYPRLVEGGVDGGFWTIYVRQGPRTPEGHAAARDRALLIALRIREMVARHPAQFALATRADDAARLAAEGRQIVYLSMENGYPLGRDLSLIRTFREIGVRMMGVVHSSNNELADSATDVKGPEWRGLSALGREMVAECNRLGVVVDASHASDLTLGQILELSTAPIVLSHSGCKAVTDHPRNVPDALLRALAAKGGVIQMNAFSAYVSSLPIIPERNRALQALTVSSGGWEAIDTEAKRDAYLEARRDIERRYPQPLATFDEFMAHVLHALRVAGVDHVGFSGDFDGGGGVADLMDVTGAPRITARLLAEGYSEADVAKFWGGNVLRVLRAAEARAAAAR